MRETYNETMGHVGRTISGNLPLSIGVLSAVVVVAVLLRQGTVASFAGLLLGVLVMMWSEKGFVSVHAPPPAADDAP